MFFPETQQSDNFTPAAGIVASHFNFAPAVLGRPQSALAALELNAPPQYIEQWSGSVEKSLGSETTLELGYLGSHGVHLQRSHLINNAATRARSYRAAPTIQNFKLPAGYGPTR